MKVVALLFLALCTSAQLCGLYGSGCHEASNQQIVLYKYEDSEFPHALDLKLNMYGDEVCSSSNVAVGVTFSTPLKDCSANATDYTNCVTARNATGTFTMYSNVQAAAMTIVCNPPLADGESVDILTTTTQCTVAGVIDLIYILRLVGAEIVEGQPIPLKRVGDKLCIDDTEDCSTLVDSTGCLAPTAPPTEPPTEGPTAPPTDNTVLIVVIVIVVIVILAVLGFFVYKFSTKKKMIFAHPTTV